MFTQYIVLRALQTSRGLSLSWFGNNSWPQGVRKKITLEHSVLHVTAAVRLALLVTVRAPSQGAALSSCAESWFGLIVVSKGFCAGSFSLSSVTQRPDHSTGGWPCSMRMWPPGPQRGQWLAGPARLPSGCPDCWPSEVEPMYIGN